MFNILSEMHPFAQIPEEFILDTKNVNPEIRYDKLSDLLRNLDYRANDYLIKNHFGAKEQRDLILSFQDVFVFDIERDLKDIVVSGYYYDMKFRDPSDRETFKRYYWTEGRYLADLVRNYHTVWNEAPRARSMLVSYGRLKEKFSEEVKEMGRFLGLELDEAELKRISDATSIGNLREKYEDNGDIKFFRKGVVGDWVNHFQGQMLGDIEAIENSGIDGLSFFRKNYGRLMKRLPLR
jgi:hypothetical protein